MYLDTNHTLFTKINSKSITDLKVKRKTVKLLDNIGENLDELGFGKDIFKQNAKGTIHEREN